MDRELKATILRIVREEVMRLVEAARQSAAPPDSSLPVLLMAGRTELPPAWHEPLAAIAREPGLGAVWVEERYAAANPLARLASIMSSGPAPRLLTHDAVTLDAARRDAARGAALVVMPASLDAIGAVAGGLNTHPPAALILHALAAGRPVHLVGNPLKAEGFEVTAGHPFHTLGHDLLSRMRQLGATHVSASEVARVLAPAARGDVYVPPGKSKPTIEFFTEDDIEDMHAAGQRQLLMKRGMRLTPSARDRAGALGVEIVELR